MAPRAVDIVDVTPPEAARPEENPPPDVGRTDPAVPPSAPAAAARVAASVGRTLGWLIAATLTLVAGWLPVTSELHLIPPVFGVPLGFIRRSTNGWGQVTTTHSSFEGIDPAGSGQPVAVVFCLCALAMLCAALLSATDVSGPTRLVGRRPAATWVGGSGGLVLAGTVAGIRAERLPQRPLDLPYGIQSQYGWGLWLAAAAVVVAALACWPDRGAQRDPADRRSAAPGVRRGIVAAGLAAAVLALAAAMARAYSVSASTSATGVRTTVVYRFSASGAVAHLHRPPVYSDLGATLDEVRAVDYLLPLVVAGAMLLVGVLGVAIAGRRERAPRTGTLAVPGLFLSGLVAAQLVNDHAVAAQLRLADATVVFTDGATSLLTGAAAAVSLASWARAAHPEWFSRWTWPRKAALGAEPDPTPTGADLLL